MSIDTRVDVLLTVLQKSVNNPRITHTIFFKMQYTYSKWLSLFLLYKTNSNTDYNNYNNNNNNNNTNNKDNRNMYKTI